MNDKSKYMILSGYAVFVFMIIYLLIMASSRYQDSVKPYELIWGIHVYDIFLVTLCPILSHLGLEVANSLKRKENEQEFSPLVGLTLGLVISLYFVGAIRDSVSSVARVCALAILFGYQAPNLWISQEKVVKKIIDRRLKEIEQKKLTNESS